MTLDARSIIAIISAAGLIGSGVLEGLGMASTPQWLIGTAAGWVTTFLGITIYQSKFITICITFY